MQMPFVFPLRRVEVVEEERERVLDSHSETHLAQGTAMDAGWEMVLGLFLHEGDKCPCH